MREAPLGPFRQKVPGPFSLLPSGGRKSTVCIITSGPSASNVRAEDLPLADRNHSVGIGEVAAAPLSEEALVNPFRSAVRGRLLFGQIGQVVGKSHQLDE